MQGCGHNGVCSHACEMALHSSCKVPGAVTASLDCQTWDMAELSDSWGKSSLKGACGPALSPMTRLVSHTNDQFVTAWCFPLKSFTSTTWISWHLALQYLTAFVGLRSSGFNSLMPYFRSGVTPKACFSPNKCGQC